MAGVTAGGSVTKQPSGFQTGTLTVGTSAVQGPDVNVATGHKAVLSCPATNTASVYMGGPGVTTSDGTEIEPGGGAAIAVDNLNKLYFISTASGQTVKWACEVE